MLEPFGSAPIQALFAAVRMSSRHHASCAAGRGAGGASRDRTGDLLVANQALSQLSYGPSFMGRNRRDDFGGHYFVGRRQKAWFLPAAPAPDLVGLGGVAPPTSPLSGVRSN